MWLSCFSLTPSWGVLEADDTIADKDEDKVRLKEMSTIRITITYVELGTVVPFKSAEVQDWGPVHEVCWCLFFCSGWVLMLVDS